MINEESLPEEWVLESLGNVCEILDAQRIPVNAAERKMRISNKLEENLYPYYGATGEVGKIDDYIFDGEFVLVGEDAAPFFDSSKDIAYLANGKFWVNNHAHIITSSILKNSLLCFYLNQFNFKGYVSGTTRLKLPQGSMKQIPIKIPPANEQKRIVDKIETLFSEVDAGIANLTLAKRQLEQYRQSLLQHAFEGKLTAEWRKNYAKHTGKSLPTADELLMQIQTARQAHYDQQIKEWEKSVKAWEKEGKNGRKPSKPKYTPPKHVSGDEIKELPNMPENFIYTYLSNTGVLARGKSKHRPRNDKILFDGDYPFLQTGEIKAADKYVVDYTRTYNEVGLKQSKLWEAGTLCITIAANIADTAFLTFDACFPDSIVGYKAYLDIINPEYVEFFIQSAKSSIEFYAPATAQKNINLTTLENLLIPFCSLEEQNRIVELLELNLTHCKSLENDIDNSLNKLSFLKTSILHKAFQGKLVPQDPNDPPASELLAQIKAEREAQALAEQQAKDAKKKSKSTSKRTPKKKAKVKTKATEAKGKSAKIDTDDATAEQGQIKLPL